MYFDFGDDRPDIQPIGRAITWREGVLLSIILHLVFVIALLVSPDLSRFLFTVRPQPEAQLVQQEPQRRDAPTFVFVQPRVELPPARPPQPQAAPSDRDRTARTVERPPKGANPLPFSRGNTPERVDEPPAPPARAPSPPAPDPNVGAQARNAPPPTEIPSLPQAPSGQPMRGSAAGSGTLPSPGDRLASAIRNTQRFAQVFNNPNGGGGEFGPAIEFDTKGVEFGPWIRRFLAQVRANWLPLIPYAAMSQQGHVAITFNVHKNGTISDITVVAPCPITSFNTAAFGALSASNPTQPLPAEYPDEKAFITLRFYYNETPE
jgi:TonB family protein